MRYAEYPPSPAAAAVVDCYWILEGQGTGIPEPIFPDGRIELILHFGEPFERHHPTGLVERQEAALAVGQMRAPICVGSRGQAGVAGIRLRPAAARTVLRCRADEITGHIVNLDQLLGSTIPLRERLAAAAADRERIALLDGWMRRAARRRRDDDVRGVEAAVQRIQSSGGSANLMSVAQQAGISLRQLERRFLADVGLTPKMLARVVRLQRALRTVAAGAPLVDSAAACGYYDQAHMARDFGALAETSPAAWRHYAGSLTPLFVGR